MCVCVCVGVFPLSVIRCNRNPSTTRGQNKKDRERKKERKKGRKKKILKNREGMKINRKTSKCEK